MAGSIDEPEVQPVRDLEELPSDDKGRIKDLQGYLRTYFRNRQPEYEEFRETLNQANMPVTYYDYLAKAHVYAAIAGFVALLLGAVLSGLLIAAGGLASPVVPVPDFLSFLSPLEPALPFIQASFIILLFGAVAAGLTRYSLLSRPAAAASARRREIEVSLPHGIFFMYTLSHGGMDIESIFRKLANSENQYGELSKEFQGMVNDVEYFGTDLITALRNTRNRTPSPGLNSFLDDLLTIIDSGGDVTTFLDRESENYVQRASEEQESFLETLSLISEAYLALLIAGPIFVLVGLLVIAILGGQVIAGIFITVYLFIPLLSAMMVLGIDLISAPYELRNWRVPVDGEEDPDEDGDEEVLSDADEERVSALNKKEKWRKRWATLRHPKEFLKDSPGYSMVVTVPLAVVALAAVVLLGLVEPSLDAMINSTVGTTAWLILLPAGIIAVPYTVFYEMRRSEVSEIRGRLPPVLSVMSNANEIGMSLTESLDLVVDQAGGRLVDEMERVRNDIHWNAGVSDAFARSANRLRIPAFSRVFNLIKEANKSSGDLHRVLTVAARDASTQRKFRRLRYQQISSYVTVVVLGFFVYLFILVLLDTFYIQRIVTQGGELAAAEGEAVSTRGTPVSLDNIPTEELRMAYFHSAIIQGVCAGMISGKILRNDLKAGLKYAIALSAVALVVFALLI